jgi:Arc/MetJ-type ribon-helix-helix transcriptional regulator
MMRNKVYKHLYIIGNKVVCLIRRYTTISIPIDLYEEIQENAIKKGLYVSVADFIREAIRMRLMEIQLEQLKKDREGLEKQLS